MIYHHLDCCCSDSLTLFATPFLSIENITTFSRCPFVFMTLISRLLSNRPPLIRNSCRADDRHRRRREIQGEIVRWAPIETDGAEPKNIGNVLVRIYQHVFFFYNYSKNPLNIVFSFFLSLSLFIPSHPLHSSSSSSSILPPLFYDRMVIIIAGWPKPQRP